MTQELESALAAARVENERYRDALESIRRHVADLPSALAKAIVATCDAALSPPAAPETKGASE